MNKTILSTAVLALLLSAATASADNSPITIPMVTVGNPGNPGNPGDTSNADNSD